MRTWSRLATNSMAVDGCVRGAEADGVSSAVCSAGSDPFGFGLHCARVELSSALRRTRCVGDGFDCIELVLLEAEAPPVMDVCSRFRGIGSELARCEPEELKLAGYGATVRRGVNIAARTPLAITCIVRLGLVSIPR
ncbi:unnamed protein product [Phytophthora fragariaefolia]|uniref:Unnamed protein product n=1 Tax=Phytophthora fragariaefolia TaxID=1490495 RepID=A0A9W6TZ18_9STRA|nr:unnamed protein product [Phytophthora fragariaefolia]